MGKASTLKVLLLITEGNHTRHRMPTLLRDKRAVCTQVIVGDNARELVKNLDERFVSHWCCLLEFIPKYQVIWRGLKGQTNYEELLVFILYFFLR